MESYGHMGGSLLFLALLTVDMFEYLKKKKIEEDEKAKSF